MAVTGLESTDDLRLQLARKLYTAVVLNASILKVKDVLKIIDIERIVNVLKKRGLWNGIRGFLQNYPCSFLVTEENGCAVIKPIVTIEFCRDFDGKRGCNKSYCHKLHVCRHFVKGKCTFGPRCKKPHHFQNENTREVLKKHFLGQLNDEECREFLCRNVQHFLDPELANAELPKCLEICKYYNVATGCTRDFCPFIHVCRFFAEDGNCKFGGQCIRKHDINNVHSKILLHRYHMDHLNEQQVLAYLKIKGENRGGDQPLPNGMVVNGNSLKDSKTQSLSSSNNSLNTNISSGFVSQFSLPNSVYGSLHSLMSDHSNSRKLSSQTQSAAINGLPSMMDSLNPTRKLSLPTPPMGRSNLYRPSMSREENNNILLGSSVENTTSRMGSLGSNSFKVGSWSADLDVDLTASTSPMMSHHNSFVNSSSLTEGSSANSMRYNLNNENSTSSLLNNNNISVTSNNNGGGYQITKPVPTQSNTGVHLSKSYNDTHSTTSPSQLTRDFQSFSLHDNHSTNNITRDQQRTFSSSLGLHNLSLPNVHNAPSHQRFQFTDHFDNYHSDPEDKLPTSVTTSNGVNFSNSLRSQTSSLFTNRNPILRTSSNDIISPTGSSSSINGLNNNNRSPVFDVNDPFSEWNENGERMFKSFSAKENDDEFSLPYYRTRSLPNFETTSLYKNSSTDNSPTETTLMNGKEKTTTLGECICQRGEICLPNINGGCNVMNCLKQHSNEPFLWQIAAIPSSQKAFANKNLKNDSTDIVAANLAWINVDENENMKLELAFCSVELEQSEIEVFGDSIMINFDEMTGEGRFDVTEHHNHLHNGGSRACDLSAWLLQATEEVPSRRNSQDAVFYHIRRLTTPSSITADVNLKYATQWRWYWQDSFGMWRSFPKNSSDVIETSAACLSDDIEAKFLAGLDQCLFEEQKVLLDFKTMVQINCQTGKQKKIRRRPLFVSKEQRSLYSSPTGSVTDLNTEISRPWYWDNEKNENLQNTLSSYQLVDVDESSEMLSNVRNLFSRSMIGKSYEIISVKSVQNPHLWTKFVRLRSSLKSNGFKLAEKFVFKRANEKELSGICQQGFPICMCKQSDKYHTQNSFTTDAKCLLTDKDETNGEIKYMFCIRMAVLLSDLKNKSCSSILAEKVEEESEGSSSDDENNWVPSPTLPNKNNNLMCRHGNQIYPEFLVVFRM
eukprot:TCONS_00033361-protein